MKNSSQKVLSGFARKIGIVSLMAVCFALLSSNVSAQTTIVNYDFNMNPCTAAPATTALNVTSTFAVTTGTCASVAGTASTAPPAFVANAAGSAPNISGTTTPTLTFTLGGTDLNTFTSYKLFFQTRSSGTGPSAFTLEYSVNGGAFISAGTFASPQTSAFVNQSIDLSGITDLNNATSIVFRISGSGGASTGTFRIDNFQVQAIGPTAAGATISGRITSTNGRGIRNVRVMLAGGSLTEPIYATSTSFGYYQFPQVPSGETYVLQVFSKNYIFDSSSIVINLTEDLTETNFTGRLRGNALTGR